MEPPSLAADSHRLRGYLQRRAKGEVTEPDAHSVPGTVQLRKYMREKQPGQWSLLANEKHQAPRQQAKNASTSATSEPRHSECNTLPWDDWRAGEPTHLPLSLPGRMGNNLFQVAAAIAMAAERQGPLVVDRHSLGPHLAYFPCVRTSRSFSLGRANPISRPRTGSPFFQDLAVWGNGSSAEHTRLMRAAFWMRPPARQPGQPRPGSDDLVLYYRSFAATYTHGDPRDAVQALEKHVGDICFHRKPSGLHVKLCAPSFEFFAAAVDRHYTRAPRRAAVWLVCEPQQRSHPTVRRVLHVLGARLVTAGAGAIDDFRFLRSANHLAMAPSTFGWWAGYLSHAHSIQLPILPAPVPMPWCKLLPIDDERYEFHDVYARRVWRGGRIDSSDARARCDEYVRNCSTTLERSAERCAVIAPVSHMISLT